MLSVLDSIMMNRHKHENILLLEGPKAIVNYYFKLVFVISAVLFNPQTQLDHTS